MSVISLPSKSSSPVSIADFTAIYDLYQVAIFQYCLWECRDRELSKDLTQETFVRFWECLQRKQAILLPRPFLYKIAHNLVIDHIRKKREVSLDGLVNTGFEPSVDLWHETHNRLDAEKPLQKLATLAAPFREVLRHRFIGGLSPASIAEITGDMSNTVSVRIFRGIKNLRQLLNVRPATRVGVDAAGV